MALRVHRIRESFRRVMTATDYSCSSWTLCIPIKLTKEEHIWWSGWKSRQETEFDLKKDFIKLMDGLDLIENLRNQGLYNQAFDEDIRTDITLLLERTTPKIYDFEAELAKGSHFIKDLKNYFSRNNETHLVRAQVQQILEWINSDRKGNNNLEKVLVVKGKKGVGKSTVIADAYREINNSGTHHILAIKCDQYYDINTSDLAKQLFSSGISFEDIFSIAETSGKQIVIFLDQLDALYRRFQQIVVG